MKLLIRLINHNINTNFPVVLNRRLISNTLRDFVDIKADATEDELYLQQVLAEDFQLKTDFINKDEEESLMQEIEKAFRRTKYQYDHWDGVCLSLFFICFFKSYCLDFFELVNTHFSCVSLATLL